MAKIRLRPMKGSEKFVILPSADAGNRNYSMLKKAWDNRKTKENGMANKYVPEWWPNYADWAMNGAWWNGFYAAVEKAAKVAKDEETRQAIRSIVISP